MKVKDYRVESGTMRVRVRAVLAATREARRRRKWRALGVLTRVQRRNRDGWGPWQYVETTRT